VRCIAAATEAAALRSETGRGVGFWKEKKNRDAAVVGVTASSFPVWSTMSRECRMRHLTMIR